MKKNFSHPMLRKQLELLNFAIGGVLILISLIYAYRGEIDFFASWFVFGCMYMVMDKYWPSESYTPLRIRADIIKYSINIAALIVSIYFLIYLI